MNGWKELFKNIVAIYREGSYLLEGQVKVTSLTNKTKWAEKSQVFFKKKKIMKSQLIMSGVCFQRVWEKQTKCLCLLTFFFINYKQKAYSYINPLRHGCEKNLHFQKPMFVYSENRGRVGIAGW